MPDLRMDYTLTQADLAELRHRAKLPSNTRLGLVSLLSFFILLILIYAASVVLHFAFESGQALGSPIHQMLLFLTPAIFGYLWAKIMPPIFNRISAQALWNLSPSLHQPQHAEISEDGLHCNSTYGSSHNRWVAVQRMIETPNLIVLGTSGGHFIPLPKRALPEGTDLPQLLQWISSHINSMMLPPEAFAAQNAAPGEPLLLPLLHFALTPADLVKANRLHPRHKWARRAIRFAIWLAVLIGTEIIVSLTMTPDGFAPFLVLYVIFFISIMALAIIENLWNWKKVPHLHGPQSVEITDSGLRFITPNQSTKIGWGALARFIRGRKLFVLVCRDDSLRIIPESALLNGQNIHQFEALLQQCVVATAGFVVLPPVQAPYSQRTST